jgi:uncharacterized protein YkwD
MKYGFKKVLIAVLIAGLVTPAGFSFAANAPSISDLQAMIQQLQEQIRQLQAQINQLKPAFVNYLQIGTRGAEVKELQEFLKTDHGIYPEGLTTGYFGPLTQAAVKKFQKKHGIEPVGVVGPKTRAKLNELLTKGAGASGIIPPGLLIAPGIQKKFVTGSPDELQPGSTQYVVLPKPVYDLERLANKIQELINNERVQAGLSALAWDEQLAQLAADHSQDQARDNQEITNPNLLCHYPLIRHEGFSFGFTLKDRLNNRNVSYRLAGENIAIIPLNENLVYRYEIDDLPSECPEIAGFESAEGTQEEITKMYQNALAEALSVVRTLEPVEWVNMEWLSAGEIAEQIVEGWMGSSGHRRNILTAEFDFGGVGIVEVNNYLVVTHNFVGR